MKIAFINGPNLNMLGTREQGFYGVKTLKQINEELETRAKKHQVELLFFQSNFEGKLVEFIHSLNSLAALKGIIINAAAFTHSSIAIRDALLSIAAPFIEVHISNVYSREAFRKNSYFSDKAIGSIVGLGDYGYHAALEYFIRLETLPA